MKTIIAGLWLISLSVVMGGEVSTLSTGSVDEIVTPERLERDEWLKTYLSRGCSLIYTVKTTREQSVVNGRLTVNDTNGVKVLEWNFKEGVLHGEAVTYYSNGGLSSRAFYEHGMTRGSELYWNEDGSLYRTAFYSKGKKHGLETYWNPDGSISSRIDWHAGEVGGVEFYEDGVLTNRITGDAAKNFFRDKGREAARKLLKKKSPGEDEKNPDRPE